MAVLYILAGINHFINPTFYLRIIPPVLKYKQLINSISGAAEILLGILLLTSYRPMAAIDWCYRSFDRCLSRQCISPDAKRSRDEGAIWGLWLRLPAQGLLIWWAWQYV